MPGSKGLKALPVESDSVPTTMVMMPKSKVRFGDGKLMD